MLKGARIQGRHCRQEQSCGATLSLFDIVATVLVGTVTTCFLHVSIMSKPRYQSTILMAVVMFTNDIAHAFQRLLYCNEDAKAVLIQHLLAVSPDNSSSSALVSECAIALTLLTSWTLSVPSPLTASNAWCLSDNVRHEMKSLCLLYL